VSTDVTIKDLRLLIRHRGELRKLARLAWSNFDASFYVMPYGTDGRRGWVGKIPIPEEPFTFDATTGTEGAEPYVSLHESGRTHASVKGFRTGDAMGPAFRDQSVSARLRCGALTG
jgi:hypothetical protein